MKNCNAYINGYAEKILNNEIEHCADIEKLIKNNIFPVLERDDVYIDNEQIEKGLTLQKYFPYDLTLWEKFLFACIAGIKYRKDNSIYFTDIRIIIGRGAGKNGFISFLCFYFLSPAHNVRGYDIDILANSETQAKVSFNDIYEIITSPKDKAQAQALKSNFYATKELIIGKATKSYLEFNTSSKKGKDSKRSGCVIFDEKHEYTDVANINTLKSGLGKKRDARVITITTDGHTRGGVLDKEKEQNADILKEYDPDNRTLVYYCHIENEDEWKDPAKWVKANPSIDDDTFSSLKAQIAQEVKDMPYNMDYYSEFMAKRMNFPIGNKDVEVASWDDICACNDDMPELTGSICVGGVDYAKTNDFVSCCLLFKKNNKYYLKQRTFICAKSKDLPGIKAPLKEYAENGEVEFINDVEIPAQAVSDWFAEQGQKYIIKRIAVDNFRYSLLNKALKEIGFDAFEIKNIKLVRPSDIIRVAPIINSIFVKHNLSWGSCQIMRWFTNNTKKIQKDGNITYGKIEKNYRKTDGFMAFVSAMTIEEDLIEYSEVASDVQIPLTW